MLFRSLAGKATRDIDSMDIPGSSSYESKRRQVRIYRGFRMWCTLYMEDQEKRHKDRARLKRNNKLLKALIRHHNIDLSVDPGSEEEWSDLDHEEEDAFAHTDEDDPSSFSTEEESF